MFKKADVYFVFKVAIGSALGVALLVPVVVQAIAKAKL